MLEFRFGEFVSAREGMVELEVDVVQLALSGRSHCIYVCVCVIESKQFLFLLPKSSNSGREIQSLTSNNIIVTLAVCQGSRDVQEQRGLIERWID